MGTPSDRGWAREFDDPIVLRDGRVLRTLLDAGNYIGALSRKEQSAPEWYNAVEALLLVAEKGGPTEAEAGHPSSSILRLCEANFFDRCSSTVRINLKVVPDNRADTDPVKNTRQEKKSPFRFRRNRNGLWSLCELIRGQTPPSLLLKSIGQFDIDLERRHVFAAVHLDQNLVRIERHMP